MCHCSIPAKEKCRYFGEFHLGLKTFAYTILLCAPSLSLSRFCSKTFPVMKSHDVITVAKAHPTHTRREHRCACVALQPLPVFSVKAGRRSYSLTCELPCWGLNTCTALIGIQRISWVGKGRRRAAFIHTPSLKKVSGYCSPLTQLFSLQTLFRSGVLGTSALKISQ